MHLVHDPLARDRAFLQRLPHMLALAEAVHARRDEHKCQRGWVVAYGSAGLDQPLQWLVLFSAVDACF